MNHACRLSPAFLIAFFIAPAFADDKKAEKFDPSKIKKLQVTLPTDWKDDGTFLDVRTFLKEGKDKLYVFALMYKDEAPKTPEALAELAKKDESLFPSRLWVKTSGVGKLTDGVFIVGIGKALGFEQDALGAVRTIDGKTVLFTCVPSTDAAARKEMLGIVKSAKFGP